MAKKKQEEEIKTDLWKDTFSDLMNLLLCFYVLLYSMSNVDEVKYAELVASLSNSFSIFSGGAQSLGEGTLVSSGATQLSSLDEFYTDMGKKADSDVESDPLKDYDQQRQQQQKQDTEALYSDVVESAETNRLQDSLDVTMDDGYSYVMISLSGGVLFRSGSAELQSSSRQIMSRVGSLLRKYEKRRIKIEGHTDNVPIKNSQYDSNLWLSTARAAKVYEYLTEKCHLNAKYLEASGRGEKDPVATNKTAAGRAKNRRIEIKIYSDSD